MSSSGTRGCVGRGRAAAPLPGTSWLLPALPGSGVGFEASALSEIMQGPSNACWFSKSSQELVQGFRD